MIWASQLYLSGALRAFDPVMGLGLYLIAAAEAKVRLVMLRLIDPYFQTRSKFLMRSGLKKPLAVDVFDNKSRIVIKTEVFSFLK